jgi:uncharacterized protein YeaC (DUF1315 family)
MERSMKLAIAASLGLAVSVVSFGTATAGDWQWGCLGPMGDGQILFSRYTLIIAPAKPVLGKLEELFRIFDLSEKFPDAEAYNAEQTNDGLQKTMTYASQSNPNNKLTLTENSSKEVLHRHHLVCGRDEDVSIERKVYRVERPNTTPIKVTLQCREYLLTTRGGRPCISD